MSNLLKSLLVFILLLCSVAVSYAFEGEVIGVSDGDTISVLNSEDNQLYKIRLYGIDCPESSQEFGDKARDLTYSIAFGKSAVIQPVATDRYGRTVAMVFVDDVNINEFLIKNRFAWVYPQYCTEWFCEQWLQYEQQSRQDGLGLWSTDSPLAPWEWRHSSSNSYQSENNYTFTPAGGNDGDIYEATIISTGPYHGNVESMIFHDSRCRWYNCKNCLKVFEAREEAIQSGYRPCKKCRP